jgi:hypothetical protein
MLSQDATSEIQDPVPPAHKKDLKRKRGNMLDYQEEILYLENKELQWFIKQGDDNYLNFFSFLVLCVK